MLLGRSADADAGVVDQDVEAAEGLPVAGHDRAYGLLVRQVGGDVLDPRAFAAQHVGRPLELVGLRAVMVT